MDDAKTENLPSLEKAGEILAKRVQGAFIELLTEEQMKAMVKQALAQYTTDADCWVNGQRAQKSPLEQEVVKQVQELLAPLVSEAVKQGFNDLWDEDKMQKFVRDCVPGMMEVAMGNLVTSTVQRLKDNIPSIY